MYSKLTPSSSHLASRDVMNLLVWDSTPIRILSIPLLGHSIWGYTLSLMALCLWPVGLVPRIRRFSGLDTELLKKCVASLA